MDLTSAIIGLCSVAFFAVPIIYIQWVQKNKKKEFLKSFLSLAEQQHLIITQHELWNQYYAIGIDARANKLLYLKRRAGEEQNVLINLSEVEECRLINSKRKIKDDIIIDRLELAFKYRNPKLAGKTIEFYDKEVSMSLNEELKLIEKWKNIINAKIGASGKALVVN